MAGRRTRTRSRAGRRSRRLWPPLELPPLEQRHQDLIGLALVGCAAFFACVFYLGWRGGEAGAAVADGVLFLFGAVAYFTPIALFAAGALLVVRPMLPAVHPLKAGALCLGAALTLGLAAGSLGLGPGETPRDGFLDADYLERHGGLIGESLFWVVSRLFSEVGAHILFVFLLVAGVLLLTGASIAGIVTGTRRAATHTGERVRRTAATLNLPTDALTASAAGPGGPLSRRESRSSRPSLQTASRSCAPPMSRRPPWMPQLGTPISTTSTRRSRRTSRSRKSPSRPRPRPPARSSPRSRSPTPSRWSSRRWDIAARR